MTQHTQRWCSSTILSSRKTVQEKQTNICVQTKQLRNTIKTGTDLLCMHRTLDTEEHTHMNVEAHCGRCQLMLHTHMYTHAQYLVTLTHNKHSISTTTRLPVAAHPSSVLATTHTKSPTNNAPSPDATAYHIHHTNAPSPPPQAISQ